MRRRIAFKPAAILADEVALGYRARRGDAHHEHRRGGGVGHTGCLPVPSGTIVWLSGVRSGPSWPLSRPLRAFQSRGDTPGWARNIRIAPVNAVGSARSATPACAWTAIEATRGPSSGCCSEPTAAAGRRTTGRDRDRSGDAHTVPGSVAVPSATVMYQAPLDRPPRNTLAATSLPLRTPFVPAVRLIQRSHLAILAGTGSNHSPLAFYIRKGWLFHRNTHLLAGFQVDGNSAT